MRGTVWSTETSWRGQWEEQQEDIVEQEEDIVEQEDWVDADERDSVINRNTMKRTLWNKRIEYSYENKRDSVMDRNIDEEDN